MAITYYDDILIAKLKRWLPSNHKVRVLGPNEGKRLLETQADDSKDKPLKLPLIALSRDSNITLLHNIKQPNSFDGPRLIGDPKATQQLLLNMIPIKVDYQLDIYAKTQLEVEEYVRSFVFKLINNPTLMVEVPYNGTYYRHIANIRLNDTISDTSDASERIFAGQFCRWTLQLELQDAFLFNIPYKDTWRLVIDGNEVDTGQEDNESTLDVVTILADKEHVSSTPLNLTFAKNK